MPWGNSWKIYQRGLPHLYALMEAYEPSYKPANDVFAEDGKTSKRYRAERERLAKAMRSTGICVVSDTPIRLIAV